MDKTFTNFIRTNPILKIKDQKFSNEVIFEEVLKDADLKNINLLNFDFEHTDLYDCDFWICSFQNCNFHRDLSLWRKCNFYDCTFENCKLSECEWSRVDFYSSCSVNSKIWAQSFNSSSVDIAISGSGLKLSQEP